MTSWWRKGLFMPDYVTKEHFDASLNALGKKFVTKDEFKVAMDRMDTRFDEVITFLKRLDQERIFTIEWIRRLESDVHQIKDHLKLA